MARLRTHNRRARRTPYHIFALRRRRAQRILRYAAVYGAGPRRLREVIQDGEFGRENASRLLDHYREAYPSIHEFVDRFFRQEGPVSGTVTGRMVVRGPEPQYQIPKRGKIIETLRHKTMTHNQLLAQAESAAKMHRAALDEARARGDTVIEHTYADATIIPKED